MLSAASVPPPSASPPASDVGTLLVIPPRAKFAGAAIQPAHLGRKEIENYLIVEAALLRLISERLRRRHTRLPPNFSDAVHGILTEETERYKHHVQSQLASNRTRYFRDMGDHRDGADIMRDAMEEFDEQWCHMEGRLKIVPGKDLISALAKRFQEQWNVSLS